MIELINLLNDDDIDYKEDAIGIIFKTDLKGLKAMEFEKRLNDLERRFHFDVEISDLMGNRLVCERTYKVSHNWDWRKNFD